MWLFRPSGIGLLGCQVERQAVPRQCIAAMAATASASHSGYPAKTCHGFSAKRCEDQDEEVSPSTKPSPTPSSVFPTDVSTMIYTEDEEALDSDIDFSEADIDESESCFFGSQSEVSAEEADDKFSDEQEDREMTRASAERWQTVSLRIAGVFSEALASDDEVDVSRNAAREVPCTAERGTNDGRAAWRDISRRMAAALQVSDDEDESRFR